MFLEGFKLIASGFDEWFMECRHEIAIWMEDKLGIILQILKIATSFETWKVSLRRF